MEIVIMYFLKWGFEIDMEERGDTVKHASECQSLSLAVNNDSTAALCLPLKPCWSLRESCQGNSEWNKSIVLCQKVEGDLGEARQETNYSDLLSFVSCMQVYILNGDEWKGSCGIPRPKHLNSLYISTFFLPCQGITEGNTKLLWKEIFGQISESNISEIQLLLFPLKRRYQKRCEKLY